LEFVMTASFRCAVLAAVLAMTLPLTGLVAQEFSQDQRKELGEIIRDYLIGNPEVLREAVQALERKEQEVAAAAATAAIGERGAEIYRSEGDLVAGNPDGSVSMAEFFDYNCGYCKKALVDVAKLIEQEKQVKVVLKELPILTKGSEEAAKVALAAKMQGKYWEFHRAMLSTSGQANEASALRVAEKVGLDMPKLKKDMASAEIAKEIDDTRLLAEKLQVRGTPFFMIADRVIPGAPANLLEQMAKHVAEVRQQGGCKVC
jgi:protein-disulfide isomerase